MIDNPSVDLQNYNSVKSLESEIMEESSSDENSDSELEETCSS